MSRADPRWVGRLVVDIIQHDLIVTHGGLPGLRDEAALESVLARPRQAWSYADKTDIAALAAAYAYGIARNHPFNDGNKRVAFVVAAVLAELNGQRIEASESDVVDAMLRLADGNLHEDALAEWIAKKLSPVDGSDSC